nr:CD209 antigen-like protein 2 [Biomphalaria glabrata]
MKNIVKVVLFCLVKAMLGTFGLPLMQQTLFYEVTYSNVTMLPIDVSVDCTSLVCCGIICQQFSECYSFFFNETTKECSLGSWLIPSNMSSAPKSPNEVIYSKGGYCDPAQNMTYVVYGSIKICLWTNRKQLGYSDSSLDCKAKEMQLYTRKTLAKRYIAAAFVGNTMNAFWLGLTDLLVENVFRWDDDNTVMDSSIRQLFAPGI